MVRKPYEDCCKVRMILKGLGIRVGERDVSMHIRFKEELKELLGERYYDKGGLPKVFIGKKYIVVVEEIHKLHNDKKLEKLLDCCERIDDIEGGDGGCEACGDIKFVPCETCHGSCKIYYEDDYEEDDNCEVGECGFQRCPHCNENDLIRCYMCCF
ncbi:putative thioredoxin-like protein [Medicago truncatula]|nr:putative thioredoxin-like protein [Medicago truncatula]